MDALLLRQNIFIVRFGQSGNVALCIASIPQGLEITRWPPARRHRLSLPNTLSAAASSDSQSRTYFRARPTRTDSMVDFIREQRCMRSSGGHPQSGRPCRWHPCLKADQLQDVYRRINRLVDFAPNDEVPNCESRQCVMNPKSDLRSSCAM